MAHYTTEADLPMMDVPSEFVFTFEAISPTTGAAITSVEVANVVIYGEDLSLGGLIERKVPALTPEEVEGL